MRARAIAPRERDLVQARTARSFAISPADRNEQVMTTAKDILTQIKEKGVKYVDYRFSDARGQMHHVTFDVSLIDDEALEDGLMFDGSSIDGWRAINDSDMKLRPDLSSASERVSETASTAKPTGMKDRFSSIPGMVFSRRSEGLGSGDEPAWPGAPDGGGRGFRLRLCIVESEAGRAGTGHACTTRAGGAKGRERVADRRSQFQRRRLKVVACVVEPGVERFAIAERGTPKSWIVLFRQPGKHRRRRHFHAGIHQHHE